MLERKKGTRKLSFGVFMLLFLGVFLAIIDGIVAITSIILLAVGQNYRWEMLLLAAGILLTALAAAVMIRIGVKRNRLLAELRRYCRLLESDPTGDCRRMAQLMSKTEEQVGQELAKLVRLNCFAEGIYLDEDSGRLRLPAGLIAQKAAAKGAEPAAPAFSRPAAQPEEFLIVVCSQCGAVNRVPKGGQAQCQGCKAQLSGQPPKKMPDFL